MSKPDYIKICLNSMVANEEPTILRMLESCYKYIDYWVIQDNGSTDRTKEIIQEFFDSKKIPGFLYEIPWKYPGWNRDHTLQKALSADHSCDWILRMDADEELKVEEFFEWDILKNTNIEAWNVPANSSGTMYYRTWLWNSKLPWYFKHSKRHETIHLPDREDFQRAALPQGFLHIIHNDGQTWANPKKFLQDALEIERDLLVNNSFNTDLYHLFYIGKSFFDAAATGVEWHLELGKSHFDLFCTRGIYYLEKFIELTEPIDTWQEMRYYSIYLIGKLYRAMKDFDNAVQKLFEASNYDTDRNDHFIQLIEIYKELEEPEKAYYIIQYLKDRKNPYPRKTFLIQNNHYIDTGSLISEYISEAK